MSSRNTDNRMLLSVCATNFVLSRSDVMEMRLYVHLTSIVLG